MTRIRREVRARRVLAGTYISAAERTCKKKTVRGGDIKAVVRSTLVF